MTAPGDDASADLHGTIAALRRQLDERAGELAARDSAYGERIAHQSATSDVLRAMAASPGDAQPVFDLIVRRASELCGGRTVGLLEYDGQLVHFRAHSNRTTSAAAAEYSALFPMVPTSASIPCRAILERKVIHIRDKAVEPGVHPAVQRLAFGSNVAVPILRGGAAIGAIFLDAIETGGFSDDQIQLLQAFAEQAVIAIGSAETFRALQMRTRDLQESLEYQTATGDVLKVISRSTFDLQPVLDTVVRTAARLCDAEMAMISRREGDNWRVVASVGYPPQYDALVRAQGAMAIDRDSPSVGWRTAREARIVHIHDVAAVPGYHEASIRLGRQRTSLGVPLFRAGEAVGTIMLARQRVEPFTDRQIELVSTFADQAVIAIENTRLLTETREALEQQTATADVLQAINASPGNLERVFATILEKAILLCDSSFGGLSTYDGEFFSVGATRGMSPGLAKALRERGPLQPSKSFAYDQIVRGADIVHIADITALGRPFPSSPNIDQDGARTTLFVALRGDETLFGVLVIFRKEVRLFSDRQIALLKNFAAQAVIAMENARLITEQREALERQTATAEVLEVINASPGDLAPVFDAMLEKAMRLCGAAFGSLYTYDGEHFRSAAQRGVPAAYAEYRAGNPPVPRHGIPARLLATRRPVHVVDVTLEDHYRAGEADVRAMAALAGTRTILCVPLLKDDAVLGFITIYRQEVRAFSEKQIALLENFAAQAVIAMENVRLITEQREALERQTAIAEVLQVINESPGNLEPVFDAILAKAMRLCDAAFGMFNAYDGTAFRTAAMRGVPVPFAAFRARHPPVPGPGTPFGRAFDTKRPVHVADWLEEPAYKAGTEGGRAIADLGGARTVLNVPLVKETTVLGMISFYRQQVRPFSDTHIALLENFAAQAVIAMENARLITETREALEQQTATAEVLQVINESPGNIAPVFDAVLEKAIRLCDSAFGMLATYDGHIMYYVAMRGLAPEQEALLADRPLAAGQPTGRIGDGENVVHLLDATDQDGYRAGFGPTQNFVDQVGARTAMWVALRKDKELLGILTIFRRVVRAFSDKEIALVQSFASQAVIAMENARLLTEQQEALDQQTATAEVLQVINASPGDLAPVFDTMLKNAIRLCGASLGSLYTYDGEQFRPVALRGVAPAFAELIAKHPPTARPGSPPARMLETKRPVHVPDVMDEEMYRSGTAPARALVDVAGVRALVNIPLVKDDTILGFVAIYRQTAGKFSDKQIALLENFAAQTVIAMESARLLHELRARTNELVQRQSELRITFENMGDGVAMFDETQRLIAWNRKFQDVLDVPDEIIAQRQTFPEYVRYLAERGEYGADADPEEQVRRLAEQAGQYRTYERIRPDGRAIEIRRNPVPGGGFVLIYADVTERKRSEAEVRAARDAAEEASRAIEAAFRDLKAAQANLIQAEKMASLGQLTAGIAHEIKNPLNFVNNFSILSVELLAELKQTVAAALASPDADLRADVEETIGTLTGNLEKITEHGRRADGIVKSMLEHSRGASGERRAVDLNALIDAALSLAYHGARAQDPSFNITLERDFADRLAPIELAPQDMTRVFLNLFSNGFYAANRRARNGGDRDFAPTLKVTTRERGAAVEIRVRDNGAGIAPDIREKLFQPFFTTKPTGEGTGLGLSISYDIVTQQHGGTITVDSEVGAWTEFMIGLPRQAFAATRSAAA